MLDPQLQTLLPLHYAVLQPLPCGVSAKSKNCGKKIVKTVVKNVLPVPLPSATSSPRCQSCPPLYVCLLIHSPCALTPYPPTRPPPPHPPATLCAPASRRRNPLRRVFRHTDKRRVSPRQCIDDLRGCLLASTIYHSHIY